MIKKVYVVINHQEALKRCLNRLPLQTPFFWIYLGKEIYKSKKIEEIIGAVADRLNISDDLQECAKIYRQDYINYIGKLSLDYSNPLWYLTSLSEKNPFVSDFFLHFCYIKICQKYIIEQPHNLIIVCENQGIFNSLRENLQNNNQINIIFYDSRLSMIIENLFLSITRLKNKLIFLFRFLLRVVLAKIFSFLMKHSTSIKKDIPVIIMHSWTDSRSFSQKSDFDEVYLGDLGKELERDSKKIIYLADILPTIWYPKALYNLFFVDKKIYLMEEFLSFSDVVTSLYFVYNQYPKFPNNLMLKDVDVRALVAHDFMHDKISSRMEQSYLNLFISREICNCFTIRSFIYSFENHIWEKAFCAGFKANPEIKTIGYAIVFINRMYTCFSVSQSEKEKAWLPDLIFVSGCQGKAKLVEYGFAPDKIVVGGAIRYPNIQQFESFQNKDQRKNVLIVLGPSVSQSLEILYSSLQSFSEINSIKVMVKCHPIVPFRSLSKYLSNLPEHFRVVNNSIEELLKITDLVVYAESTVCVEALAKGIPILHIGSNFTIDINIFEDMNFAPSANSPEQICSIALKILNHNEVSPDLINTVIGELFTPADYPKILSTISGE